MSNVPIQIDLPVNEPVLSYAPGTEPRKLLKEELCRQSSQIVEIPLIIGGKEVRTDNLGEIRAPHNHQLKLGIYHQAGPDQVKQAISACREAAESWACLSWASRAAVFQRAAELLAGPYRMKLNAATMLGQSKTVHQAEIDSGCEMVDFLRFNTYFWNQLFSQQPVVSKTPDAANSIEYRPLEGFVFAVSPFNFTAIGGNLPTAPAMAGNVVIWKPASTAVLSNYYLMKLLMEAGLPAGVVNFLPGKGSVIGSPILDHSSLAGLHFTGSTGTFNGMWQRIGNRLAEGGYRNYPRLVGETGGKNFVLACPDADVEALCVGLIRGAFEYQGQKCSAASRAYIPASLWKKLKPMLVDGTRAIKLGDVCDFRTFMGAVIDEASFRNISSYLKEAFASTKVQVLSGGKGDSKTGWMIPPTIIEVTDPYDRLMKEELFGPVLSVFVYPDQNLDEMIRTIDQTCPYALTGAVFGSDRTLIDRISGKLRNVAGNFYINDKPTGAVVGQQPFGGGRASGTNDKAGSILNLVRWVSPRTIKETFLSPRTFEYSFMAEP